MKARRTILIRSCDAEPAAAAKFDGETRNIRSPSRSAAAGWLAGSARSETAQPSPRRIDVWPCPRRKVTEVPTLQAALVTEWPFETPRCTVPRDYKTSSHDARHVAICSASLGGSRGMGNSTGVCRCRAVGSVSADLDAGDAGVAPRPAGKAAASRYRDDAKPAPSSRSPWRSMGWSRLEAGRRGKHQTTRLQVFRRSPDDSLATDRNSKSCLAGARCSPMRAG